MNRWDLSATTSSTCRSCCASGFAVSPQDGHFLVKRHAHWVTPNGGGRGAGRDVCELLMLAQGTFGAEMQRYY